MENNLKIISEHRTFKVEKTCPGYSERPKAVLTFRKTYGTVKNWELKDADEFVPSGYSVLEKMQFTKLVTEKIEELLKYLQEEDGGAA